MPTAASCSFTGFDRSQQIGSEKLGMPLTFCHIFCKLPLADSHGLIFWPCGIARASPSLLSTKPYLASCSKWHSNATQILKVQPASCALPNRTVNRYRVFDTALSQPSLQQPVETRLGLVGLPRNVSIPRFEELPLRLRQRCA